MEPRETCRSCLFQMPPTTGFYLLEKPRNNDDLTFKEIFESISGYWVNENEPQYLCESCSATLLKIYKFKRSLDETQQILSSRKVAQFEELQENCEPECEEKEDEDPENSSEDEETVMGENSEAGVFQDEENPQSEIPVTILYPENLWDKKSAMSDETPPATPAPSDPRDLPSTVNFDDLRPLISDFSACQVVQPVAHFVVTGVPPQLPEISLHQTPPGSVLSQEVEDSVMSSSETTFDLSDSESSTVDEDYFTNGVSSPETVRTVSEAPSPAVHRHNEKEAPSMPDLASSHYSKSPSPVRDPPLVKVPTANDIEEDLLAIGATKSISVNKIKLNAEKRKQLQRDGRLMCIACNENFSTKSSLNRHLQKFHKMRDAWKNNTRTYSCSFCNLEYKSKQGYRSHRAQYHSQKETLSCFHCEFQTRQKRLLKQHLKSHEPFKVAKHRCEECDRVFDSRPGLEAHKYSHTDEKNFKCEECGNAYKRLNTLKIHKRKVHSDWKPFRCPVCRREYTVNWNLRWHIEKEHPDYKLGPKGTVMIEESSRLNPERIFHIRPKFIPK